MRPTAGTTGTALKLTEGPRLGRLSIHSELEPPRFQPHSREGLRPSMLVLPVVLTQGEFGVTVQVDFAPNETVEDDFEFSRYRSPIPLLCLSLRGVEGESGRGLREAAVGGGVSGSGEVVRRGMKWVGLGG